MSLAMKLIDLVLEILPGLVELFDPAHPAKAPLQKMLSAAVAAKQALVTQVPA